MFIRPIADLSFIVFNCGNAYRGGEAYMNIVIAPDSFKGSLTSIKASKIMKRSILDLNNNYNVTIKPMADGGEGTLETLLTSIEGEVIPITCTGPLGEEIHTNYAIVDSHTAIIECANIAGLMHVPIDQRNPDFTTSYGIGEVIIDALDRGCTSFVIGLGGSSTNDGGLGMLQALGMETSNDQQTCFIGKDLHYITQVDFSKIDSRLSKVDIKIACDVDNPLCGDYGASAVYGPQKGATKQQVKQYDDSLSKYGDLIEHEVDLAIKEYPGAGAAGGLGFAFLALQAKLSSGAALLADAINLEEAIQNADLVITGEGQSDQQTLYGKAPFYIASLAAKHRVPTVLISGSLEDVDKLSKEFLGCFSIINKPLVLKECIEQAEQLLYEQTKQIFQLVGQLHNHQAYKYV